MKDSLITTQTKQMKLESVGVKMNALAASVFQDTNVYFSKDPAVLKWDFGKS